MLDACKMSAIESGGCELFHRHLPTLRQIDVRDLREFLRKALDHLVGRQFAEGLRKPSSALRRRRHTNDHLRHKAEIPFRRGSRIVAPITPAEYRRRGYIRSSARVRPA